MLIKASPMHYSRQPHKYIEHQVKPEESFPKADGTFGLRNFDHDVDHIMDIEKDLLMPEHFYLPYNGARPAEDPTRNGDTKVKLHPVEVVIDKHVLESMVAHARKVCGVDESTGIIPPKELFETGGALAGLLKQDTHGRVWVHITHSLHDNPEAIGSRDMVKFDLDAQGNWLKRIHKQNLVFFGYWHSHPTYSPFQSDERFWGQGADVQTTQQTCKAWWKLAMVIDPFPIETKEGIDAVEVGAYKMVSAGEELDEMSENGWTMGWRSASVLIKNGGATNEE